MGLPANSLLQTSPSFLGGKNNSFGQPSLFDQVDPDKTGHVDFPDFLRLGDFLAAKGGVQVIIC